MKARIKSVILSAIGVIGAFSMATYSSCNSDKCKTITCAYQGVCNEGKCICQSGYEGPQCETVTRKKYLGTWVVTENGSITDASQYTVAVVAGPNMTEVRIKNFRNFIMDDVNAFVKKDSIYIPQQSMQGQTIIGYGWVEDEKYYGDNGRIVLKYKVTDDATGASDDFGYEGGDPSLWNK